MESVLFLSPSQLLSQFQLVAPSHALPPPSQAPFPWQHLVPFCQSRAGVLFRCNPSLTLHQAKTSESSLMCFQVACRRGDLEPSTPPGSAFWCSWIERLPFRLEISRGSFSDRPSAPATPVLSFPSALPAPGNHTLPLRVCHSDVVSYPWGERNHLCAFIAWR